MPKQNMSAIVSAGRKKKYGQLVIGPPGSGKTTYSYHMCKYLNSHGRKSVIVNLDPGNSLSTAEIDVRKLISVSDSMLKTKLGANGALLFCMEYINKNLDWLIMLLASCDYYVIFDCPGQVELYAHHHCMTEIFERIERLGYNLCTVNLIDSHYCGETRQFISILYLTLNAMLTMKLPQINLLSKADLRKYDPSMMEELQHSVTAKNLHYITENIYNSENDQKYSKFCISLLEMVEDSGLIAFHSLNSRSQRNIAIIKSLVDNSHGFKLKINITE